MLTIIKTFLADFLLKLIMAFKRDKDLKDLGASEVTVGAVKKVQDAKKEIAIKDKPTTLDDVLDKL